MNWQRANYDKSWNDWNIQVSRTLNDIQIKAVFQVWYLLCVRCVFIFKLCITMSHTIQYINAVLVGKIYLMGSKGISNGSKLFFLSDQVVVLLIYADLMIYIIYVNVNVDLYSLYMGMYKVILKLILAEVWCQRGWSTEQEGV